MEKILNQLISLHQSKRFPLVLSLIGNKNYEEILNKIYDLLEIKKIDRSILDHDEKGKSIGIGQARKFKEKINSSAYGQSKIGIIKDAHLMTEEAANSLLKLTEELPPCTYLIFISESDKLISTLKSRITRVFYLPGNQEEKNFLQEQMFLTEMTLSEKLTWLEKEQNLLDLKKFIQNILTMIHKDQFKSDLKERLLKLLTLLEANVNKKVISEYLALICSKI